MSDEHIQAVLEETKSLHSIGLNPFPLQYGMKKSLGKWMVLQWSRLHHDSLEQVFGRTPLNLGIVCGSTSRNLFVVDCDDRDQFRWMQKELADRGMRTWVRSSHRGGHFYFLCTDGSVLSEDRHGLEILGQGTYVLAAPSIHPDTGELLTCDKPERAPLEVSIGDLGFLQLHLARVRPLLVEKGTLPDVAERVLVHGDTSAYGGDNSSAEYAACLSLIGRGFSDAEILQVFGRCKPPHFCKVGEERFRRYVLGKAREISQTVPGGGTRPPNRKLDAYLAALDATPFPGRHGKSDKMVLVGLAKRMRVEHRGLFRASVRELAELAGLSVETVRNALKRLVTAGYISVEPGETRIHANLYRLNFDKVEPPATASANVDGDNRQSVIALPDASHDVWHRNALGKSGLEVLRWLSEHPQSRIADMARGVGCAFNTVKSALTKMQQHDLVTCDVNKRWSVTLNDISVTDLNMVAFDYGTRGRAEQKATKHNEQRERRASRIIVAQVDRLINEQREPQRREQQRGDCIH